VCSAAAVVGVNECVGLGPARGGAFRAISPVEPLCPRLASGLSESGKDRVVIAEDGAVGSTRVAESPGRAWRNCADGLSERDAGVAGAGGFTAGVRKEFAAGEVEVREVVSPARFSSAGDVGSTAGIDFWVSWRRFASGPRPTVNPTERLITANKKATAAT
jgi:hypothetical protein